MTSISPISVSPNTYTRRITIKVTLNDAIDRLCEDLDVASRQNLKCAKGFIKAFRKNNPGQQDTANQILDHIINIENAKTRYGMSSDTFVHIQEQETNCIKAYKIPDTQKSTSLDSSSSSFMHLNKGKQPLSSAL